MKPSYGINFKIINDVYQPLNPLVFGKNKEGHPYVHLATIGRGFKEYCAYADVDANKVWIEEVDPKTPSLFKKIKDDNEFYDLMMFLDAHRLLEVGSRKEIKAGKEGLSFNVHENKPV